MPPAGQPNFRRTRLQNITLDYVEKNKPDYLYCALHRRWEPKDVFAAGRGGQQRRAVRYCLKATREDKANFDTVADMTPTDQARRDMAKVLKLTLHEDDAAAEEEASSSRSARAGARNRDGPAADAAVVQRPQRVRKRLRPTTRAQKAATAGGGCRPRRTPNATLMRIWTSRAGRLYSYQFSGYEMGSGQYEQRKRRMGTAADLPACRNMAQMTTALADLLERGVLRRARPRKLHLSMGCVEHVTNALPLVKAGSRICGQAAMETGTGMTLAALGVPAWRPDARPENNRLSYADMNSLFEDASAAGRAFVMRKPFARILDAREIFGKDTGMFVTLAYYVPEDEGTGANVAYGREAMGCRCAPPADGALRTPSARISARTRTRTTVLARNV